MPKDNKTKKKFYKRWWFWVLVVIAVIVIISASNSSNGGNDSSSSKDKTSKTAKSNNDSGNNNSGKKVSTEYNNAYETAKTYMSTQGMSKKGLYDQLTADTGEKFKPEAATYAVNKFSEDDYKKAAVKSAKTYSKDMHLSASDVYSQLTSDSGEKYTPDEAKYAINKLHLGNVDTSNSDNQADTNDTDTSGN
ncbi:Ltp family lipoprotein (plasmid) [Fructilactobacillus ixorae]|uniref:Ltp family lipoprotein n=1 Tax=Fructilactobacillus ixorae TaxID=1750535 RepID=A0ABY5C775_9LACO|nr:Ltp family lipoprotein [Fructilactobacillus ixorae]USS93960.1 Ltp family lipoprotein [Fructilactobacillus ixorae]